MYLTMSDRVLWQPFNRNLSLECHENLIHSKRLRVPTHITNMILYLVSSNSIDGGLICTSMMLIDARRVVTSQPVAAVNRCGCVDVNATHDTHSATHDKHSATHDIHSATHDIHSATQDIHSVTAHHSIHTNISPESGMESMHLPPCPLRDLTRN